MIGRVLSNDGTIQELDGKHTADAQQRPMGDLLMNHQERGDHLGPTAKATPRPFIREIEWENLTVVVPQAIKNEALQRHQKGEKGTGHRLMACTTIAPTVCENVACLFHPEDDYCARTPVDC